MEHVLWSVDVRQEGLQGAHPLDHAGLDELPLGGRDQPRDQVQRKDPLPALLGERHSLVAEAAIAGLAPSRQVGMVQHLNGVVQPLGMGVRGAVRPEHLVVRRPGGVVIEQSTHGEVLHRLCYRHDS